MDREKLALVNEVNKYCGAGYTIGTAYSMAADSTGASRLDVVNARLEWFLGDDPADPDYLRRATLPRAPFRPGARPAV